MAADSWRAYGQALPESNEPMTRRTLCANAALLVLAQESAAAADAVPYDHFAGNHWRYSRPLTFPRFPASVPVRCTAKRWAALANGLNSLRATPSQLLLRAKQQRAIRLTCVALRRYVGRFVMR